MTISPQQIADSMVRVHLISRELANYHVATMSDAEIERRFHLYSEMELSVAGRNTQSESDFYPVFGFATATARLAALNPVPEFPTERGGGRESARAGSKKPGPMAVRALSAGR